MFPQTDVFWIFDLRSKITFVPRQKSSKTKKEQPFDREIGSKG